MSKETIKLTSNEINEKNKQLADAFFELGAIKAAKKEAMNGFKMQIDAQENLIYQLSDEVRSGKEIRSRTFFDNNIE